MLLYELILFFVIYFVCGYITKYTELTRYTWFFNLYSKALEAAEPKWWHRIVLWKLLVCTSCHTFWLSLLLGYFTHQHIEYFYIQYALLTYLIKQDQSDV